ncbi:MAG: hypothetical protein U1F83_15390 [Verrucomicrobiota bacterium]
MKRSSKGGGVYQSAVGRYWARPWINGRRTWRVLAATTARAAFKEVADASWRESADTVAALAKLWLDADCPNSRLEPQPHRVAAQAKRVENLLCYFGKQHPDDVRLTLLPAYAAWRKRRCRKSTGERTVDMDLVTLSNVLTYGVLKGICEFNAIRTNRPKYRKASDVRHARVVMPPSADAIHQLADYFFSDFRSEVFGWQALFAMFTGTRTSELLRLRTDARTIDDPGFIQWARNPKPDGPLGLLHIQRSKHGMNPEVIIGAEFADMLACHKRWRLDRYPRNPFYLPGKLDKTPVESTSFGHALRRACRDIGLPHITPHGFRAYYVTKRRSDGVPDTIIASEIGDATVSLMHTTYGDRPKSWLGGEPLGWMPAAGLPAWARWQPEILKVVKLKIPESGATQLTGIH